MNSILTPIMTCVSVTFDQNKCNVYTFQNLDSTIVVNSTKDLGYFVGLDYEIVKTGEAKIKGATLFLENISVEFDAGTTPQQILDYRNALEANDAV